jgi:uncharacterized protein (DUF1499 family)
MARQRKRSGTMDTIALIAAVSVFVGPILAYLRLVPALVGFYMFMLGGLIAIIATLSGFIAAARGAGFGFSRTLALLAAIVFVYAATRAGDRSMINDYTTNLDDPPAFHHAGQLPGNEGRDLSYPASFADTQRSCCADLQPLHVAAPPAQAVQRAEQVAKQMPQWTVTEVDRTNGTVEAVAESIVFGFKDDIVIRVRPDGTASVVDMRSKSRDGRGDMGVNAKRIRAYLAALQQPAAPAAAG